MPAKNKKKNRSIDPAAIEILERADTLEMPTAFSRAEEMKPCPIGADGRCCKNCAMGPCRLTKPGQVGICGATLETVTARNLARAIAAGASAHSDHGRGVAFTLLAAAEGHAPDYQIRDAAKLSRVARYLGVPAEGLGVNELAKAVAEKALAQFGQQRGELAYLKRAPEKRQEVWREMGLAPRGVDMEVVETLHRTHVGNDQDPEHILDQAMRCALSDGWGGSMLATELTDILFGTPSPAQSRASLGVLAEDEVNIVVHGHEPTLSEMILTAVSDPEIMEYAHSKGAKGINLTGICCTANELLMRQGIPLAGNFLNQELAILTGAIESMIVDIQCIMEALAPLSQRFHTKLITTSPKVKIEGAMHIPFEEERALEIAKEIVRLSIDNYANRDGVNIPKFSEGLVGGFSHEYIRYMLGGTFRGSFRALNDAVMAGRLRGAVGIVGCCNPRVTHDEVNDYIVREMLKNDVLVVQTGCGAIASSKYGLLAPEALKYAGHGLRETCEAVGIPPVLHLGSCVDNSRILTVLTECVLEGGLGDDISDLPVAGIAPEWMSEKALSIATYFVASGVYTIMGVKSPVGGSEEVTRLISEGWGAKVGGKLEFESDPQQIVEKVLAHIDKKRAALGIEEYDPQRFAKPTITWDEAMGYAERVEAVTS
jgi:carbon-monoxide dehydrogenase catalytic subunit